MIIISPIWEFKKRAAIVLKHKKWHENPRNTKNGMKTQEKAHFGVFQQQQRAELSHP